MDAIKYTYWRGQYRYVNYEIVNWNTGYQDMWAAYIMTNSKQIKLAYESRKIGQESIIQTFDNEPILTELSHHTHGGITLYEVTTNPGTDIEHYRIGWDYQHLGDDGRTFSELYIYGDVVNAINALWNITSDIKVWCSTVGGWHSLNDGMVTNEGVFISREGQEWRVANGYKPLTA